MAITLSSSILEELEHGDFDGAKIKLKAMNAGRTDARTIVVDPRSLSKPALEELRDLAKKLKNVALGRTVKAFLSANDGDFMVTIPNIDASAHMVRAYLLHEIADGWIYVSKNGQRHQPELVTDIDVRTDHRSETNKKWLEISTIATSRESRSGAKEVSPRRNKISFPAEDVTHKTVPDVLASVGILKETPELRAEYDAALAYHLEHVAGGFAKQYELSGHVHSSDSWHKGSTVSKRKVINDLMVDDYSAVLSYAESCLFTDKMGDEHPAVIPFHTVVKVFDLKSYDFYWADSVDMKPYEYDQTLSEKLILPETHRGLLDVLTNDLTSFTGDIVRGKSTGNIILCTGIPGIGKTLTAEVYSETLQLPMYSVHSGNLGTTAKDIAKNLEVIFQRAKRWNCVVLLDEADVFVAERGNSIEQNAICAEFLRALEYTEQLIFMTTNRHHDIDDAILSRCLAVIRFHPAEDDDARAIWKILSKALGHELDDGLVDRLVSVFPLACGRDIKQLCGTVFRMNGKKGWGIDIESFRRAAMFRGVDILMRQGKVEGVNDQNLAHELSRIQDELETSFGFRPTPADAVKYLAKSRTT